MSAVKFDVIRKVAFGTITNSYANFGAVLAFNWRVFKITNNTDGDMLFSLDGTNDNIFVPANGFTLYDLSTNSPNINNTDSYVMPIGAQFRIKYSTAPTSGDVYLEALYATGV